MKLNARIVYLLFALTTIVSGLATRKYAAFLPGWFAEYGGDTLWGMMVYWLVSLLFAGLPCQLSLRQRAAISLVFAFVVEFSQLYQAPWINLIRETRLGGLVLGFGFLWSDLVCYSVGILLAVLVERLSPIAHKEVQLS